MGLEDKVEEMNRLALRMARKVAQKHNKLFAGNICNTDIYNRDDTEVDEEIRAMFTEQVRWTKEEEAEFIIAETYKWLGEAKIALDVIKSFDLLAIINFEVLGIPPGSNNTFEHVPIGKACKELLDDGAYLVGANCSRGPEQLLEVVKEIIKFARQRESVPFLLGSVLLKIAQLFLLSRTRAAWQTTHPILMDWRHLAVLPWRWQSSPSSAWS